MEYLNNRKVVFLFFLIQFSQCFAQYWNYEKSQYVLKFPTTPTTPAKAREELCCFVLKGLESGVTSPLLQREKKDTNKEEDSIDAQRT